MCGFEWDCGSACEEVPGVIEIVCRAGDGRSIEESPVSGDGD